MICTARYIDFHFKYKHSCLANRLTTHRNLPTSKLKLTCATPHNTIHALAGTKNASVHVIATRATSHVVVNPPGELRGVHNSHYVGPIRLHYARYLTVTLVLLSHAR